MCYWLECAKTLISWTFARTPVIHHCFCFWLATASLVQQWLGMVTLPFLFENGWCAADAATFLTPEIVTKQSNLDTRSQTKQQDFVFPEVGSLFRKSNKNPRKTKCMCQVIFTFPSFPLGQHFSQSCSAWLLSHHVFQKWEDRNISCLVPSWVCHGAFYFNFCFHCFNKV